MGWRLYRRKRLLPGVTLGLSRSGPSLRFGVRGAGLTVGGRSGLRTTVGVPGTGVYYTSTPLAGSARRPVTPVRASYPPPGAAGSGRGWLLLLVAIVFIGAALATSGLALFPEVALIGIYVWWRRSRTASRAARLVAQALTVPGDQAVRLLHSAVGIDPHGLPTLRAAGRWFLDHECWADAVECLGAALALRADVDVEEGYTKALAYDGRYDEVIERLDHLRTLPLEDESHASLVSLLAQVYLFRGDAARALALVSEEPLTRHKLGFGLQQCLSMRAQSRFLLGQKARAMADVDRLYAINPAYRGVAELREEMAAGTFAVAVPAPYPGWYPADLRSGAPSAEPAVPS